MDSIIVTEVYTQEGSVSEKFHADRGEDGQIKPAYFSPADCTIYPDTTILGKRKPLKVAVYTLTMDRLDYTKQMYKALNKLAGLAFDWYVIDQGSKDGTQEWLKSQTRGQDNGYEWRKKLRYTLYKDNVGLAAGWNNIIQFIKAEGSTMSSSRWTTMRRC